MITAKEKQMVKYRRSLDFDQKHNQFMASKPLVNIQTSISLRFLYIAKIFISTLAHLVSRLVCNAKVIVDASSYAPISRVKIAVTKSTLKSPRKQTATLTFHYESVKW